MRIIPVIDLQDGVVVRGVAGRREEYRPIVSQLVAEPTVRAVAEVFAKQFGFREVYVADLDAIAGHTPNLAAYEVISACGMTPWIDAGIATVEQTTALPGAPTSIIAGLESLASPDDLQRIVESCGAERVIFSLDLKAGQPITNIAAWRTLSPDQIAAAAVESGISRMIVLDLTDVGVGRGTGTLELVTRLRQSHPQLELTGGGGVRDVQDLRRLADAGCDAALVASALHDGRIAPPQLQLLNS